MKRWTLPTDAGDIAATALLFAATIGMTLVLLICFGGNP